MSQALLIPGISGLNLRRALFAANEVGGIWDWSDRSTLFQDPAGTTPVTASGQTVGLHLDKSQGLVLGPELYASSGWVFNSTFWTQTGDTFTRTPAGSIGVNAELSAGIILGRFYRVRYTVNIIAGDFRLGLGSDTSAGFPGPVNIGPGLFVVDTAIYAAHGTNGRIVLRASSPFEGTISNISVQELPGNHRYQASAGSRPQYVQDGNLHYGLYDGSDDFMETNAVDFTGTNKMTVWWGGRKLTDGGVKIALELSADAGAANGVFNITIAGGVNQYRWFSKGTTIRNIATTSAVFAAPHSAVLVGIGDISAPDIRLRINGNLIGQSALSQGTGNYGNHKLFFGSRAGTSLPFNGREYITIIRGAATPTPLIERVEREVRRKVGITW